MPRGGARIGAGRPRKHAPETGKVQTSKGKQGPADDPLQYMLAVMNDDEADPARRDRMAVAAAPYLHGKVGEAGKKGAKAAAAKTAGAGRFATGSAPRLVSNRG